MLDNIAYVIREFPGAELIHSLQGAVVGILLVRAYIERCAAQAIMAFTILVGFAIYEGFEMWRIHDQGDVDFQIFLIMMWVAILGPAFYAAFHNLFNYIKQNRSK